MNVNPHAIPVQLNTWGPQDLPPDLVFSVFNQLHDRDAFDLVNALKSLQLQQQLTRRMQTIGDTGFQLARRIDHAALHTLTFKDLGKLLTDIEALPEPHQQAPLAALLTYCNDRSPLLHDPRHVFRAERPGHKDPLPPADIFIRLAVLVATRPLDRCEELLPLLDELVEHLPKEVHDTAYPKFIQRMPHLSGNGACTHAPSCWRVLTTITVVKHTPDMSVFLQEPVQTRLLAALCQEGDWLPIDKASWVQALRRAINGAPHDDVRQRYKAVLDAFDDFRRKDIESAHSEALQWLGSTPRHQWIDKVDELKPFFLRMGTDHCITHFWEIAAAACHSDVPMHHLTRCIELFNGTAPAERSIRNLLIHSLSLNDAVTTEKLGDVYLATVIQDTRPQNQKALTATLATLSKMRLDLEYWKERFVSRASLIDRLMEKVREVLERLLETRNESRTR